MKAQRLEFNHFTLLEKIQSNIEVHGLFWAAEHYKKMARLAAKQQGKSASNFDTFYYAVFGKWPTR
jgi:hypothetical protein